MPVRKAQIKSLRKSKKRALVNKAVKTNIKDLTKKSRKAIEAKKDDAQKLVRNTTKSLDKAAQKGIIKKNAAARKKSRLMKRLNKVAKK